jgi:UDP-3-O-[3-hydroxymyristoyl] N-acetylglucosamine deacetylase
MAESKCSTKQYIRIKHEVKVTEGDKWAAFLPMDGFKVTFTIDFEHPAFDENVKTHLCCGQIN